MNLHDELLDLARNSISGEDRPGQARLRRAVSTAYYALFHLLVDDATRRMFGPQDKRAALRACLARAFAHSTMMKVAKDFSVTEKAQGKPRGNRLRGALGESSIQPEIVGVAEKFIALQNARHTADYDLSQAIAPRWAEAMVSQAERAFVEWAAVRGTLQADTFLAGMLLFDKIRVGASR